MRRLIPLLLLLAAPLARAEYQITITGGEWTTAGPSFPTLTRPYSGQNTAFVQGATGSGGSPSTSAPYIIAAGMGTASCTGGLTAQFHWVGSAPRPKYIVVKQVANASWAGDYGNCTTGLTPEVVLSSSVYGKSVTATKYKVYADPADDFSVALSPSAKATKGPNVAPPPPPPGSPQPPTPPMAASSAVSWVVSYSVPSLTFLGPTVNDELAIGQKFKATVSSGLPSSAGDTYTWSKPSAGAAFDNYDPTASSNQFTAFVTPPNTSATMPCYFAKPASPVIQCVFHSGFLNEDITLIKSLSVLGPSSSYHAEDCGTMRLLGNPNATDFALYGKSFLPNGPGSTGTPTYTGMYAIDQRLDPSPSSGGQLAYLQTALVTNTTNGVANSRSGLDGSFPYGPTFIANGTAYASMDDLPGVHFTFTTPPPDYSYRKVGFYDSYLMYKPSASAAGASVYVPLYKLSWTAQGHCSYGNTAWVANLDDGSKISTPGTDFNYPDDAFPTWNDIVL